MQWCHQEYIEWIRIIESYRYGLDLDWIWLPGVLCHTISWRYCEGSFAMDFCWHLAHIERLQGLVETNCILIGTLLDINLKILCTSALCNAPVLSHPNMWHRGVGNMERGSHLFAVKALWLFASRLFDWEGLCEAHSDAWNMKNTSFRQAFRGCSF